MSDHTKRMVVRTLLAGAFIFNLHPAIILAEDLPTKNDLRDAIATQTQSEVQASLNQPSVDSSSQPTNNTDVTNTGDNTQVKQDSQSTAQDTVTNTNNAQVNQNVNAEANTGNNEASGNISFGGNAGVISTGDAAVVVAGASNTNNNSTYIASANSYYPSRTNLGNTGNGLSFSQNDSSTLLTAVNNNNSTFINQSVNARANTGGNKAEGNIAIGGGKAGIITTGNAYTSTSFLVTGNGSMVIVGGENDANGPGSGASIFILNTGDNPRLRFLSEKETKQMVSNNNYAQISQNCGVGESQCSANTGYNNSNGNIARGGDAGVIKTGDAVIQLGLAANVNNNKTYVTNGGNRSANQSDVTNTGDNADIDISTKNSENTSVSNKNNAIVNQKVDAKANTGHNTANGNISFGGDAGVIETGNAVILAGLAVQANNNNSTIDTGNQTSGNEPTGSNTPNSSAGQPCTISSNTTIVNTGNNLDLSQNTNSKNTTEVTNKNKLFVTQDINAKIDTGYNESNGNIGASAGNITTGNAILAAQLDVKGNTNNTRVEGCPLAAVTYPSPTPTVQPTSTPASQNNNSTSTSTTSTTSSSDNPTSTTTSDSSSTSSSDDNSSSSSSEGSVLGATISRLPQAGFWENIFIMIGAIALLFGGKKIKSLTRKYNHVSSNYRFNLNMKGGAKI